MKKVLIIEGVIEYWIDTSDSSIATIHRIDNTYLVYEDMISGIESILEK